MFVRLYLSVSSPPLIPCTPPTPLGQPQTLTPFIRDQILSGTVHILRGDGCFSLSLCHMCFNRYHLLFHVPHFFIFPNEPYTSRSLLVPFSSPPPSLPLTCCLFVFLSFSPFPHGFTLSPLSLLHPSATRPPACHSLSQFSLSAPQSQMLSQGPFLSVE